MLGGTKLSERDSKVRTSSARDPDRESTELDSLEIESQYLGLGISELKSDCERNFLELCPDAPVTRHSEEITSESHGDRTRALGPPVTHARPEHS